MKVLPSKVRLPSPCPFHSPLPTILTRLSTGLCPSFSLHLGPAGASTYTFNTSTFTPDLPAANQSGTLNYLLSGSNFNVSEPMQLSYSPVTNIAVPLFSPSDEYTQVWFDDLGEMNIHGYVDDTQEGGLQFGERSYKRWFVCETYAGYDYVTLAWVVGGMGPENPSCQGVGVVRVFV